MDFDCKSHGDGRVDAADACYEDDNEIDNK